MEPLISTSAERRFLPVVMSAIWCGVGSGGAEFAPAPCGSAASEIFASPVRSRLNTGDYSARNLECQGFGLFRFQFVKTTRSALSRLSQFFGRVGPNFAERGMVMRDSC